MSDQKNEHAHIFKFKYQNQKSALESVKIKVHEAADEEYGTYAWPSSLLLAQYLAEQHLDYQNRSLLELGCGRSGRGGGAVACRLCDPVARRSHARNAPGEASQ